MARYSINMSREHEALKHLVKVRDYFSALTYVDKNEDVLEMIKKIEDEIKEKIIYSIRILGGIMLSDPEAEMEW